MGPGRMWTRNSVTMGHFYLALLLLYFSSSFIIVSGISDIFQCPYGEVATFEKKLGVTLANGSIYQDSLFIMRPGDAGVAQWNPLSCVKRCMDIPTCRSVSVNYLRQECVGLTRVETVSLLVDNDSSYFVKICANIPEQCRSKLWALESISGSRLVGESSVMRIADGVTESECSTTLLRSSQDNAPARSSQFQPQRSTASPTQQVSYSFFGNDINNMMPPQPQQSQVSRGRCILNRENKYTQPESYRVANVDVVYKENQCVEDFPKQIDRCSYEEYGNQTLKHYDAIIYSTTTSQCKKLCEDEDQFNCRGFTVLPENPYSNGNQYYMTTTSTGNGQDLKTCLLHSEDTLSLGSWLLSKRNGATYFRRVMCLDISVECSPMAMTITYRPHSNNFRGRLYVSGFSETCSSPGQGFGQATTLIVPFHSNKCGVNKAFAFEDGIETPRNSTLMYTMLVIQNNPIIQAQGDRFVRVGCVAAPSYNLTLDTSIQVGTDNENSTDMNGPGSSSIPAASIINSTGIVHTPRVKMYIVNEPDQRDQSAAFFPGGAVSLGESIELRIEAETTDSDSVDIHAYHLVATSQLGDSSVLLLDGRGCPTGQVDFPAFQRTKIPGIVRLSSRFRAFRFPNSHVVKFSVMVQFCASTCGDVICDTLPVTPIYSSNRQSRSINENITVDKMKQMESNIVWTSETEDLNSFDIPYENATVTFIDAGSVSESRTKSGKVVVASSENIMRMREVCHEIYESKDSKIPLELSLVVASNEVAGADSLVYGENSKIVIAGNEDLRSNPSMICIHEVLFITLAFVWLFIQILILVGCLIVVKKYRSFAEDSQLQKDYHSFDNLGFESFTTNRRVHWPDQNVDILHVT